jgi:hypothetical protein
VGTAQGEHTQSFRANPGINPGYQGNLTGEIYAVGNFFCRAALAETAFCHCRSLTPQAVYRITL